MDPLPSHWERANHPPIPTLHSRISAFHRAPCSLTTTTISPSTLKRIDNPDEHSAFGLVSSPVFTVLETSDEKFALAFIHYFNYWNSQISSPISVCTIFVAFAVSNRGLGEAEWTKNESKRDSRNGREECNIALAKNKRGICRNH